MDCGFRRNDEYADASFIGHSVPLRANRQTVHRAQRLFPKKYIFSYFLLTPVLRAWYIRPATIKRHLQPAHGSRRFLKLLADRTEAHQQIKEFDHPLLRLKPGARLHVSNLGRSDADRPRPPSTKRSSMLEKDHLIEHEAQKRLQGEHPERTQGVEDPCYDLRIALKKCWPARQAARRMLAPPTAARRSRACWPRSGAGCTNRDKRRSPAARAGFPPVIILAMQAATSRRPRRTNGEDHPRPDAE